MTDIENKDQVMAEGEGAQSPQGNLPAAKKQRTEVPGEAEPVGASAGDAAADEATEPAQEESKKAPGPLKVGYKTFQTGSECYKYYQNLIAKVRKNQNLNEYEFHMVQELVRLGHPDAERKLGGGLRAVQVRETDVHGSRTSCFFLIHDDWKAEDMSYRKCVANLFPDMSDLTAHYNNKPQHQQQRRYGGGRRGRGGRGRGRGRR